MTIQLTKNILDLQRQIGVPEFAYDAPKLYTHLKGLFVLFILYDPVIHKLILSFID